MGFFEGYHHMPWCHRSNPDDFTIPVPAHGNARFALEQREQKTNEEVSGWIKLFGAGSVQKPQAPSDIDFFQTHEVAEHRLLRIASELSAIAASLPEDKNVWTLLINREDVAHHVQALLDEAREKQLSLENAVKSISQIEYGGEHELPSILRFFLKQGEVSHYNRQFLGTWLRLAEFTHIKISP